MFILAVNMFPALNMEMGSFFYLIFIIVTTIVIVQVWGPKRLVRETTKVEVPVEEIGQ